MSNKVFRNAVGDLSLYGSSSILLDTNKYLTSTDFPNTTTLYGWRAPSSDSASWTAIYGGIDLTRNGALGSQADHLANTVACDFDGSNDYLSSTNAAFNFTGTFSISCWVYRSDWSINFSASSEILISRAAGVNGWYLMGYDSSTAIWFYNRTDNTCTPLNSSVLSPGWHNFIIVRNSGAYTSIFVDGLLLAKNATATSITADGTLEIGSFRGGSSKFTGRITDVWVHNGTAWTSEQVKKIYARGSRQFATIKSDGNLDIDLPLEGKWFNFMPEITNATLGGSYFCKYMVTKDTVFLDYSLGISGASASGLKSTVPISFTETVHYHTFSTSSRDSSYMYPGTAFVYGYNTIEFRNGSIGYTGANNIMLKGSYLWR